MQYQGLRFSHLLLWVCCAHQITCNFLKETYGISHNLPDDVLPAKGPLPPNQLDFGKVAPLSNEQSKRVGMKSITFQNKQGEVSTWEYTHRKVPEDPREPGTAPVISLIVTVERPNEEKEMLFVKQYRIPNQARVLEFPRSFVGKDETMEAAVHRTLAEETMFNDQLDGKFEVDIRHITKPLAKDPGLSSEREIKVRLTIKHDGKKPPVKEDGEGIIQNLVPLSQLNHYIAIHSRLESNYMVDTSVDHYISGINDGRELERAAQSAPEGSS